MKNFFALFLSLLGCTSIYAQPGKLISHTFYAFESGSGVIASGDSFTVAYNSQVLPNLYRHFKLSDIGIWDLKYRSTDYVYDLEGNLLNSIQQTGNDTDGWVNTYQFTYTYNQNNQELTFKQEKWNGTDWVLDYQTESVYDANGRIISSGSDSYRQLYTYNAEGLLEFETAQFKSGNDWTNYTLESYTYFPNTSLVEIQISSSWGLSTWETNYRQVFQYDANGNNTQKVLELPAQNLWDPGFRTIMDYDAEDNLVYWVSSDWDGDSWEDDTRQFNTYDQNNHFTSARFELLDSTGWQMATFGRLHYGALSGIHQAELTSFEVFPNPATSTATLLGENLESAQIIDRQGRVISQVSLNQQGATHIPVSHLAQGMYFIQVTHANGEKGIKPVFIRGK